MSKYPNMEKLNEKRNDLSTIVNFLTFLEDEEIDIYGEDGIMHNEQYAYSFLRIDQKELTKERELFIKENL